MRSALAVSEIKPMRPIFIGTAILALAACSPPNRTFDPVPFPSLSSLTCTLKTVHVGVLNPKYYRDGNDDTLTLVFRDMDSRAGTARMEGNNGSQAIEYRQADYQMQFVETTMTGNLTMTTVFAPPDADSPMPSVHSRHISLGPANASISQFTGTCVAGSDT